MAGQGDQHDPLVAEHVALAGNLVERQADVPFAGEEAHRDRVRRARGSHLIRVHHAGRALEEGVAAAMIRMQMRADHDIDVVGLDADGLQAV